MFKHEILRDPELIVYHQLVQHTNKRDEVPKDVKLERAMPGLESTVRSLSTMIKEGNRTILDSQSNLTREKARPSLATG
jgi:hypothetical protein